MVPSFPAASYLQLHYSIPGFCYLSFGNRAQKLCLYPITCFQYHLALYSHVIKHYCNTSSSQTPVDLLKGPVTCGFRPWLCPRWFGVDGGSFLVCAGDARPPWVIPHPGLVLSLGKHDGRSMDAWWLPLASSWPGPAQGVEGQGWDSPAKQTVTATDRHSYRTSTGKCGLGQTINLDMGLDATRQCWSQELNRTFTRRQLCG